MTTPMFAMICANNVNRSTEAHDHLHAAGLRVCSFGAGNKVRFPGRSRYEPHIYEFFTPYEVMYRELKAENEALYAVSALPVEAQGGLIGFATMACWPCWSAIF